MSAPIRGLRRKVLRFTVMGRAKRIALYIDLHAFLSRGITAKDVLGDMIVVASRRRKGRDMAAVLTEIRNRIIGGEKTSIALGSWVPEEEAVMLYQGEMADKFVDMIKQLSDILVRQSEALSLMRGAISKVISFSFVLLSMIFFVSAFVVPQITHSVTPVMLAKMEFAKVFFSFSQQFIRYLPFWLGGLAVVLWWIFHTLPRMIGPKRVWLDDHLPPWSVYRRFRSTMFLVSASSMLESGVTMGTIFDELGRMGSSWSRWHAKRSARKIRAGVAPIDSMNDGLLPPDTADRLMIYRRLGDINAIMRSLADDNFRVYKVSMTRFGNSMKSVFTILLALYIVATLGAVFDFAMVMMNAMNR